MRRTIRIFSLFVYLILTACGGGGGGGGGGTLAPAPPPPPPPNVNLAGITLSVGTLTPAFSAQTLNYTVVLDAAADSIDLTVATADSASTLTINGSPVVSGAASGPITLPVGPSSITIVLNNGTASRTTTIVATRQDATPATATITFPPAGLTDAAAINVHGTANDPETDIVAVTVNGVTANSSDGFATWNAPDVPLVPGTTSINVEVENAGLAVDSAAATAAVTREALLLNPVDVTLDAANNRVLIADRTSAAVIAVDLTSGARSEISGGSNGSGPGFDEPRVITLDSARNRALVGDEGAQAVFAVDLDSGERTVFSAAGTGSGRSWTFFYGMDLDAANDRALVAALTRIDSIIGVDLNSGDRTLLTEELYPGAIVGDIVADIANNQVFMTDTLRQVVAAVNLDGVSPATPISSSFRGAGPRLGVPAGVLLDNANSRLLVTDSALAVLFDVDLASGDRSILSDAANGSGPDFGRPVGIVADEANGRVLVIDSVLDATVAVDPATGDRSVVGQSSFGNGPPLDAPLFFDIDAGNDRLIIVDQGRNAMLSAELSSRDRATIAATLVVGIARAAVQAAVDSANNRAFYSNRNRLAAVDLATGTISGVITGNPDPFFSIDGLAFDAVNERVLVADASQSSIISIDPATGNRFYISKSSTSPPGMVGSGPAFNFPRGIAPDFPQCASPGGG